MEEHFCTRIEIEVSVVSAPAAIFVQSCQTFFSQFDLEDEVIQLGGDVQLDGADLPGSVTDRHQDLVLLVMNVH